MKKNTVTIEELKKLLYEDMQEVRYIPAADDAGYSPSDYRSSGGYSPEPVNDDPLGTQSKSITDKKRASKPVNQQLVDQQLKMALQHGRTTLTHSWEEARNEQNTFNQFVNSLVKIYNGQPSSVDVSHIEPEQLKENAKKALWAAFSPYGDTGKFSSFFIGIANKVAGFNYQNHAHIDAFIEALEQSLNEVLQSFDINRSNSFSAYISQKTLWNLKNNLAKERKLQGKYDSIDAPLSSDDDSDTLGSTLSSVGSDIESVLTQKDQNANENNIKALTMDFCKNALKKNPMRLRVFELSAEHAKSNKEISQIINSENQTNFPESRIAIEKKRALETIKAEIESGALDEFLYQKGVDIDFSDALVAHNKKQNYALRGSEEKRAKDRERKQNLKNVAEMDFALNEIMSIVIMKGILLEGKKKIDAIDAVYNQFNRIIHLSESFEMGEIRIVPGQPVATADLFEEIKKYVDQCIHGFQQLYEDLYQIENIGFSIRGEYPQIAEFIRTTLEEMIEKVEAYPGKLGTMLTVVRNKYNPKNAYGLS